MNFFDVNSVLTIILLSSACNIIIFCTPIVARSDDSIKNKKPKNILSKTSSYIFLNRFLLSHDLRGSFIRLIYTINLLYYSFSFIPDFTTTGFQRGDNGDGRRFTD